MFARRSPGVGTAPSARAHTMYMVTYKAMYMPTYIAMRAVVRVHLLEGKNTQNLQYSNTLPVVDGSTASAFVTSQLRLVTSHFWSVTSHFEAVTSHFEIVTSQAGSMPTRTYVNVRGYEAILLPLTRTRAHVRTRRNVHRAHESSRKLTLRNLATSARKEPA